jgi:hypothetical protein
MASSGLSRRVALVRTDVSEELSAFFISVTRIGELGTTLAVTSTRRTPGTRRADRNRAHTHKMVPHRTVPKGRGPRLSRQIKADLRYGRGCLSPHKRHTQDWHTECSLLGAPCAGLELTRNSGSRS